MAKKKSKPLLPHYSGGQSREFWRRVGLIKDDKLYNRMYLLGCKLQDMEELALKGVNRYAENRP